MKKNLLIIIFNIVFALLLILLADCLFVYYQNNAYIIKNGFKLLPHTETYKIERTRDENSGPALKNSDKRPVIFSGCSITYGLFLSFEETIGYLVSQLSDRSVYNKGRSSTCISQMLYELTETKVYDEIENPEYSFFIYDPILHAVRVNAEVYSPTSQIEYLRYKLDSGKLKNISGEHIPFISSLTIYRKYSYIHNLKDQNNDYNKVLTIALFKEVNKVLHEKFPDIKFTVIVYEGNMTENDLNSDFYKDIYSALKSDNIELISVNDMMNDNCNQDKYKSDIHHPNSIVWDIVSKKLVEKYNL